MSERRRGAWHAWTRRVRHRPGDDAALFERLYGGRPTAVWLDSARSAYGSGRWSLLGAPDGPRDHIVEAEARDVVRIDGVRWEGTLWDVLADRLEAHPVEPVGDLPFLGGYVGCVGYGAKAIGSPVRGADPVAQLVHLSRFVLLDHESGELIAVAVGDAHDEGEARSWLDDTVALADAEDEPVAAAPVAAEGDRSAWPVADASVSRGTYLAHLDEVRAWLEAGDSYEACYTYTLRVPHVGDAFEAYRRLRAANPAPNAAFLRLPGREILSCSPERFLRVSTAGWAETKPIKGTARREIDPDDDARAASDLAADPKTRAENLMIVDLLRNDLGRISLPGTVEVPELMAVESYETVHQLVTTVRSKLRAVDAAGVRAAEALFPPGSMTGAPKRRTVELLDALEPEERGVYSGAIGYFSRTGAVDLSVVIRTAVVAGGEATIGTGGAITIDSDPEAEADETVAKSDALLRAFAARHPFA